ncbi:hypothetical protein [Saccharothrix carnea]|uniref:hypothetical protein n=1 Tax=Saccharothrix carnea TaxID=1280637 RepID=UPI001C637382|nr:hypothetical protein [Saccharothrix carnea]
MAESESAPVGYTGSAHVVGVQVTSGPLDPAAWRRAVADLPPMADPHVPAWEDVPRTATGGVRRLDLLTRLTGTAETHGSGRWT